MSDLAVRPVEPSARPAFSERAVARVAGLLAGRSLSRRRFLTRTAVVGSALAVNPVDYVLRPLPAYAQVTDCGSANRCGDGWTAFCATITRGANSCPPGSYVAGWWKVDSTNFCPDEQGRPGTRYYIDCNRLPSASCTARCSGNECDGRAVCRNNFRYGQCNQQIAGVTQVVCRVVTCAPPWEFDPTCTTTIRTDNRTESHNSPYLAPRNASRIRLRWQDMGQTASVLRGQTMAERDGARGGRVAGYERGYLLYTAATGVHAVVGAIARRYAETGLDESVLGYPTSEDRPVGDGVGRYSRFERGVIYWTPAHSAHEVTRGIAARYEREGGPRGWMGYPVSDEYGAPAGRRRSDFAGGWSIVWDPSTDESRVIADDVEMPADGSWPPQVRVVRWAGPAREDTAATVSRNVFEPGVAVAYVARADDFADALTGGVTAALAGGPLLLTPTDELDDATAEELRRLQPAEIVVLGGERAVAPRVERALGELTTGEVVRVDGEDRYATAAAVSRRRFPDGADACYLATGAGFADALAGGPHAATHDGGVPLLLTRPRDLPEVTRTEIARLGVRDVVVLGGPAAVADGVLSTLRDIVPGSVRRVAGDDRYGTAAAVTATTDNADEVFIVTGRDYPDGLAACPAAVRRAAPVLLTRPGDIPTATEEQLRRLRPDRVVVVGGDEVVSGAVSHRLSYDPTS